MAITSLIDKSFKIIQNIIKALFKNILLITFIYFYFIIALLLIFILDSRPDPILNYMSGLDPKISLPSLLIFSILIAFIPSLNERHIDKVVS